MRKTRYTILLVNSDSAERRQLCQVLASADLDFIETSTGVEAVGVLESEQIDLVITAIHIEPLTAWQLIRTIRSGLYPMGIDLPVILVAHNLCGLMMQISAVDLGINQSVCLNNLGSLPETVRTCLANPNPVSLKPTLLLVSDHSDLYHSPLAEVYQVESVADGTAGFALWKQKNHDLIVLDHGLQHNSGADLLADIIAESSAQPVIVLVDEQQKLIMPELMLCGAVDVVIRPFRMKNLLQVLDLALKRSGSLFCHAQCSQRTTHLKCLQQLFQQVINTMPSVLIGVDQALKITLWNHEAEQRAAVSAGQALGRMLTDVWSQFSCIEHVIQALKTKVLQKLTNICCIDQDGQRYVDLTVYPLPDASTTCAVIRIDDVTERVLLEKRILQSEKMVSMGHLAAGLAHEINNPLAGIMQNVQVVRNRLSEHPQSNKRAAQNAGLNLKALDLYVHQRDIDSRLDAIMDSGAQAARMIENMLSFNRHDESTLHPEEISDLLDRAIELAASNFSLKQKFDFRLIQIRRDYDLAMPLVCCNRTQIQQVFINLLMNGAFFMNLKCHEQRQKGLDYQPCFDLRIKNESDSVRIEVEDNGLGIDPASQSHIFDPFYSDNRKGKSPGLGLAICYFIICEHHNGHLSVESIPQEKTRFIITLPKIR